MRNLETHYYWDLLLGENDLGCLKDHTLALKEGFLSIIQRSQPPRKPWMWCRALHTGTALLLLCPQGSGDYSQWSPHCHPNFDLFRFWLQGLAWSALTITSAKKGSYSQWDDCLRIPNPRTRTHVKESHRI